MVRSFQLFPGCFRNKPQNLINMPAKGIARGSYRTVIPLVRTANGKKLLHCDSCGVDLPKLEFYSICWKRRQRCCKMHYDELKLSRNTNSKERQQHRILERVRINYMRECKMRRVRDELTVEIIGKVLEAWNNKSVYSGNSKDLSLVRANLKAGIEADNLMPFTRAELNQRIHVKYRTMPILEKLIALKLKRFRTKLKEIL